LKGFLAYQEPNGVPSYALGNWCSTEFKEIPANHFFLTDFVKQNCFYFEIGNSLTEEEGFEFHFDEENSIISLDSEEYLNHLSDFQREMSSKGIEKAIFSRIQLHDKPDSSDLIELFNKFCQRYKEEAFVYLISDPQFGTWIGATPEVLVKGDSQSLKTVALAGTKKSDSIEWTSKEIKEQAIVSDYIREKLNSLDSLNLKESEVRTVKNGAVFHLRKDFEFQLSSTKWNNLINELHPTPAVCGRPMRQAYDLIVSKEPHKRLFYTGLIGYKNDDTIAVYVNLRCMQVMKNNFALYLGGGITNASVPNNEWDETVNKSKTLLSVLED
jgi:isochorismate synthase